ncbi:MAG: hypothetical protein WC475_04780 [Candidatus Paceibacterota bacterium]
MGLEEIADNIVNDLDIGLKKIPEKMKLDAVRMYRTAFRIGKNGEEFSPDNVPKEIQSLYKKGYFNGICLDMYQKETVFDEAVDEINEREAKYFEPHICKISAAVRDLATDCFKSFEEALETMPQENKLNCVVFYKKALRVGFKDQHTTTVPIDFQRMYHLGLLVNTMYEGFSKKDREDAYVLMHHLIGPDERKLRREERKKSY